MRSLILIIFCLFVSGKLSAQNTKTETIKTAEMLQSSRSENDSVKVNSQNGTNQEPVKKDQGSKNESKPAPAPTPAPSSTKSDNPNSNGGTQKMAITEQGIKKNKKKKSQSAASGETTTPVSKDK